MPIPFLARHRNSDHRTSNAVQDKISSAVTMSKDFFRIIAHLDLTNCVEQTEDRPRFVGGFGKVYFGKLRSNGGALDVAIKRVKASLPDNETLAKTIITELKIWSRLDHRNVLRLCGYTLDDGIFPALVSEWMHNGKILNYLILNPQVELFDMVKGIANGLKYLHEEGVVHADIKSDNVLVSRSGAPLLTDFGISRNLIVTHTVTTMGELMGSVRWMAYELLAPQESGPQKIVDTTFENTVTETKPAVPSMETDVWAFGMVVYELLTKNYPFARLSDIETICAIIAGKLPIPPPDLQSRRSIDNSLWDLCTRCWNRDPTSRPVMANIVREINGRNFGSATYSRPNGHSDEHAQIVLDTSTTPVAGTYLKRLPYFPANLRHFLRRKSNHQSHFGRDEICGNTYPEVKRRYPSKAATKLADPGAKTGSTKQTPHIDEPGGCVVPPIPSQSTLVRSKLQPVDDTRKQEAGTPDANSFGILGSGMYEIVNAETKNHLRLDGDDIVSNTTEVRSNDLEDQNMVWNIEALRNTKYAIKNGLHYASCTALPVLNNTVTVDAILHPWVIKETGIKGRYVIQHSEKELFWGLKNGALGTPLTLQVYPNQPKNNWEFRLRQTHEQSGTSARPTPTSIRSSSRTAVVVITSSGDDSLNLPSSLTSIIGWHSPPNLNPNPSDVEIFNELRNYLSTQSLTSATRSKARKAIMEKYPKADFTLRKEFLDESYRRILHERDVSDGPI